MKIILSLSLTAAVLVLLLVKKLKPYRSKIICFYGLAVAGLFAFYNYRTADLILPFYHPENQMFYQPEFLETGEYTDALLPYIVKGKTVHMYDYYMDMDADFNNIDVWNSGQMGVLDIKNIMEENGAKVIMMSDDPEYLTSEQTERLCENAGFLNDTFRYSYFYNNLDSEYGNGFYYYWFYSASRKPFSLLMDIEGIREADDLYFLTDESGNMVLMSEDEFNREVADHE